jgi:hypothetical protein
MAKGAIEVNHLHPDRVKDAEDFQLDPLEVFRFARANRVDFVTAIIRLDDIRRMAE